MIRFLRFLIIEMKSKTIDWQLSHVTVLTGYRMLPRKDLVRAKVYFLIDAACAALAFSFHRVSRGSQHFKLSSANVSVLDLSI